MQTLLERCRQSLQAQTFVKLTLSQPEDKNADLKNLYIRNIPIKNKAKLSFTYRYAKMDQVKNYDHTEGIEQIQNLLKTHFRVGHLFATDGDLQAQRDRKGHWTYKHLPAAHLQVPTEKHDRSKAYLIEADAPFMKPLGLAGKDGKILAAQYDKYRQINKYIEIVDALLAPSAPLPSPLRIADMGCGKGYLTFALYHHLRQRYPELELELQGVERRADLADKCNALSERLGYTGLRFVCGDIEGYAPPPGLHLLVALHACDTATDMAIAQGIRSGAQRMITAPCCHRQLRRDLQPTPELQPLLRHGILEERQAELLTDGIRALLQEAKGYETKVFEFISNEHTAKNVMITAVFADTPPAQREQALRQVELLKKRFGITKHRLEELLDF